MADIETPTERYEESGQDKTSDELYQLKKDMAERVIDKMKEKNQDDFILSFGKKLIVDYLLDDEEGNDKINDLILGVGIKFFSSSADDLKDIREKIKNVNTKEELFNLESSIMEGLNQVGNGQEKTEGISTENKPSSSESSGSTQYNTGESISTSHVESANVGEAANVPKNERMKRLFPNGTPQTEKEMKKYLTTIKVPIYTAEGKTKKMKLTIHKRLSEEYEDIFKEMYNKRIPVNPEKTGGFNWRKMRKGSKMSHHSYGSAVDVNYDVNGGVYGKTDKNSPYFNDNETVAIRKKHGFYRGGDRSKNYKDPMHFTYMNA